MIVKVCVSGASGYLASHIIKKLLEENYYVKGLTRNKQHFLLNYYESLKKQITPSYKIENLELIEYNPELTDNSDDLICILFDCDYLIHCASPVFLRTFSDETANINKIINPAIRYTENILKAALSTNIKKVIFTSSTSTIYDGTKTKYTNKDWADIKYIHDAYSISKIESEKMAWRIYEENKKWELVVLNPGRVIGPVIYGKIPESYCSIIEALHLSNQSNTDAGAGAYTDNHYSSYCDVRDVAIIHVYALNNLITNRYIIAFEIKSFKDYCDLIVANKEYKFIHNDHPFEFENSFNDYTYISFEKSIQDSLENYQQHTSLQM